jgi:eukaryotic-like serine/threonine-protein kinase
VDQSGTFCDVQEKQIVGLAVRASVKVGGSAVKPGSASSGTRIDSYEIVSSLGAGGMGEVFRARDMKLRREVAIKILPAAFSNDPGRLRRFEQEACAAAALNHPNTLAVFHVGSYQGRQYIVSELVEGETLREQLRSGPIALSCAIDYAVQVVRGLAAVHEKGIVHRDLKPENILVSNSGKVKILDFGLAKQTHCEDTFGQPEEQTTATGTDFGTIMGSSGYMSPEQVRGRQVDHRSDIFSFGAVLYEMLAGRRAFAAESAVETMFAILHDQPSPVAHRGGNITSMLEGIVRRCLEKNPDQRFQSAGELLLHLESLASVAAGEMRPLTEQAHVVRHQRPDHPRPLSCGTRRQVCCSRYGRSSPSILPGLPLPRRTMVQSRVGLFK